MSSIIDKEGNRLDKKIDIMNCLNQHFSKIGKQMAEEGEHSNGDDLKDPLDYMPFASSQNTFYTSGTDYAEILDLLADLNPKKSCGFDMITNRVFKETSFIIAPYLEKLFNVDWTLCY